MTFVMAILQELLHASEKVLIDSVTVWTYYARYFWTSTRFGM